MEKARSTRAWSVIFKTPFQIEPFWGEEPELLLKYIVYQVLLWGGRGKRGKSGDFSYCNAGKFLLYYYLFGVGTEGVPHLTV